MTGRAGSGSLVEHERFPRASSSTNHLSWAAVARVGERVRRPAEQTADVSTGSAWSRRPAGQEGTGRPAARGGEHGSAQRRPPRRTRRVDAVATAPTSGTHVRERPGGRVGRGRARRCVGSDAERAAHRVVADAAVKNTSCTMSVGSAAASRQLLDERAGAGVDQGVVEPGGGGRRPEVERGERVRGGTRA